MFYGREQLYCCGSFGGGKWDVVDDEGVTVHIVFVISS
jgi:hypothetical protein